MKKVIFTMSLLLLLSPTLVFGKKESASEEKQELQAKLQELKEAKSESREAVKVQVLIRAKTLATKSIDKLISKYNHFATVVADLPNISETNKVEFQTKIEAEIAKLKAKKAEVAAASTASEVKAVMETVKIQAGQSNEVVKLMVTAIKKTHLESIVTKTNDFITKLEAKVAAMKESGSDVSAYEAFLAEAKNSVNSASTQIAAGSIAEAKESIISARNVLSELVDSLELNESEVK